MGGLFQRIKSIIRSQNEPTPAVATLWIAKTKDGNYVLRLHENGEWKLVGGYSGEGPDMDAYVTKTVFYETVFTIQATEEELARAIREIERKPGIPGVGIESITKTKTQGNVDTYTILYTNQTSTTFTVTNGVDGAPGTSINKIEKTSTAGGVDTYTITLTNGAESTFTVTNGTDGDDGVGIVSITGPTTSGRDKTYSINLSDNTHYTFTVRDGADGIGAGDMLKSDYDSDDAVYNAGGIKDYITSNIPSSLSDLSDDSTHRTVTDTEKTTWNGKSDFSGSYNDLTDKPTIPQAPVQSDWNQSDSSSLDYIKNKPTIPEAPVNADWNSNSGLSKILNKPTLFSGDYNDLSNKPYIPPEVTETTVTNWGFTKNTGTYSKPSGGIPKTDLTAAVQASLARADSASQTTVTPNPTVPSGATPTNLEGIKVADSYYSVPQGTYSKPSGGIPATDLTSAVQTSLGKADTAVQDVSGKENSSNKKTDLTVSGNISDTYYPSTQAVKSYVDSNIPTISTDVVADKSSTTKAAAPKAVYDEIHPTVASSVPVGGILPNKLYDLGTLAANTTVTLATPSDNNIVNHYYITFDMGSTLYTVTFPNTITWFGGSAPVWASNKHYEVSILNDIAVAMEV